MDRYTASRLLFFVCRATLYAAVATLSVATLRDATQGTLPLALTFLLWASCVTCWKLLAFAEQMEKDAQRTEAFSD